MSEFKSKFSNKNYSLSTDEKEIFKHLFPGSKQHGWKRNKFCHRWPFFFQTSISSKKNQSTEILDKIS